MYARMYTHLVYTSYFICGVDTSQRQLGTLLLSIIARSLSGDDLGGSFRGSCWRHFVWGWWWDFDSYVVYTCCVVCCRAIERTELDLSANISIFDRLSKTVEDASCSCSFSSKKERKKERKKEKRIGKERKKNRLVIMYPVRQLHFRYITYY